MIVKSRGIVLSTFKYGDTSIIARIFTESYGYGSYIVNAVRSPKSTKSMGHFQPFTFLDLVLYRKETRELQRVSEYKNHYPLHHIHQNPIKSAITLFLTEVFSKLLHAEQAPNLQLFDFTMESIKAFDLLEKQLANFHLQFLMKIGPFLGYAINDIDDLFRSTEKLTPTNERHQIMNMLNKAPYGTAISLSRDQRYEALSLILNYYQHHAHIPVPKSLDVLRRILS